MLNHDKSKEKLYTVYLSFNNEYIWTLSEPIPCTGFEFIEDI